MFCAIEPTIITHSAICALLTSQWKLAKANLSAFVADVRNPLTPPSTPATSKPIAIRAPPINTNV